jgi:Ca-activated chloride channel family protein
VSADGWWRSFRVSQVARGQAYFTSTMTLGQYIMRDFLRRKTRRAG